MYVGANFIIDTTKNGILIKLNDNKIDIAEEITWKELRITNIQHELLLQAYKDGFQAAVDSLIDANEAIKNKLKSNYVNN